MSRLKSNLLVPSADNIRKLLDTLKRFSKKLISKKIGRRQNYVMHNNPKVNIVAVYKISCFYNSMHAV